MEREIGKKKFNLHYENLSSDGTVGMTIRIVVVCRYLREAIKLGDEEIKKYLLPDVFGKLVLRRVTEVDYKDMTKAVIEAL